MADEKLGVGGVDLVVSDVPHAPVIFFENAPCLGHVGGNVNITLSTQLTVLGPDRKAISQEVAVAYLRCNVIAAKSLRAAIDQALLAMEPMPENATKN